jgi:hypothetical protein
MTSVSLVFEQAERTALLPLPLEHFACFHGAKRKVNRDGHVEVAKAYYSAPPEHVGREAWVRWDARLVRVFNHRLGDCSAVKRLSNSRCRFWTSIRSFGRSPTTGPWSRGRAIAHKIAHPWAKVFERHDWTKAAATALRLSSRILVEPWANEPRTTPCGGETGGGSNQLVGSVGRVFDGTPWTATS